MTDEHCSPTGEASSDWTRRRVLAGAASTGAVATGLAGASGAVTAQTTETTETTETDEGADITVSLVVPESTSTLGNDDVTGLLLQVVDQGKTDASDTDVASCGVLEADRIISYQVEITDERDDTEEVVEATGFAARSNDNVRPDQEFIVSSQESCGDGYVHLQLEEVTRSSVDVDSDAESTPTAVPGFGAGTAVAGVAAAAVGAAWRSLRS